MKDDDFAMNADLEKRIVTQLQLILARHSTEPLQHFLSHLSEALHIEPLELAASLLFLEPSIIAACAEANSKAIEIANQELPLINKDDSTLDPLKQQIKAILKPSEPKPEKLKMVRYRLEVGRKHDVSIEEIKNVLINESGVERTKIGYMDIRNHYTLIDLPNGMPTDIFQHLQSVELKQQMLQIKRVNTPRKRQWQRRKNSNGRPQAKESNNNQISV